MSEFHLGSPVLPGWGVLVATPRWPSCMKQHTVPVRLCNVARVCLVSVFSQRPMMVVVSGLRFLSTFMRSLALSVMLALLASLISTAASTLSAGDPAAGERLKQLLAGKMQSDSFGWFALRDFTYCQGGSAPDSLSKPVGLQPKKQPAAAITVTRNTDDDSAADSTESDLERMIGTGDSVVVLYHPHHKNKAIAWCNTLVAFSSTRHVTCHRALPTCQRCEAVPTSAASVPSQPQHASHGGKPFLRRRQTSPGPDTVANPTVDTEPQFNTAAMADPEKASLKAALEEFQDYCEHKLALAVRADCPLHLVDDWNDEPPFDLVRFCMASSADDGFTLDPTLAKTKSQPVIDPSDPTVPAPKNDF